MTIRYTNGTIYDAVLLLRTESTLRVALQGADDILELNRIAGMWVTEDCEPVQVDFAWSRFQSSTSVNEADCICPRELAAHLIHQLYSGEETPAANATPVSRMELPAVFRGAVS
jgi:hypothetical protein